MNLRGRQRKPGSDLPKFLWPTCPSLKRPSSLTRTCTSISLTELQTIARSSACFESRNLTPASLLPSQEDGRDTILRPRIYRIAVSYRLGLPVIGHEISCPLCMQT